MKKLSIYTLLLALSGMMLAACNDDFLERYPQSQLSPQAFFNNEAELKLYSNSFYAYLPGDAIFQNDISSDNVEQAAINDLVAGRTRVETSASDAGWTWTQLYHLNYFLENYHKANETEAIKNHYAGLARFFRAYFYFEKVKRFGDVPWYSTSMNEASPELYKPRDSRVLVVDSIMKDLDFAITWLNASKSTSRVSKWTALALKSRVGLFEGTYRKYHTELNLQNTADALLQQSVNASLQLMNSNQYSLYNTGSPTTDYFNLFVAEDAIAAEVILARVYDRTLNKAHVAPQVFTSPTRGTPGLTKSLIDSYLMRDGTRFSAQPNYQTKPFWEETLNRDPRLAQTIRTPGYTLPGSTTRAVPDYSNALTGYQNIKFVGTQDATATNDLPIFRYAEVLLNFAEAKAELGQFTQADADRSINLIRRRAGMPDLQIAGLTADPLLDAQYKNTSNPLILEIRRERRIELAMEGFRYDDLRRWKEGHLLAQTFRGAYYPSKGTFDLDNNGTLDIAVVDAKPSTPVAGLQYFVLGPDKRLSEGDKGNIIIHPNVNKVFQENKHYLFPLPLAELQLNPNLTQNPNWQ